MDRSSSEAILTILYSAQPERPGEQFLEVRQWRTPDGSWQELVLEHGYVDDTGELNTHCRVMPFYLTLEEMLQEVAALADLPARQLERTART